MYMVIYVLWGVLGDNGIDLLLKMDKSINRWSTPNNFWSAENLIMPPSESVKLDDKMNHDKFKKSISA